MFLTISIWCVIHIIGFVRETMFLCCYWPILAQFSISIPPENVGKPQVVWNIG